MKKNTTFAFRVFISILIPLIIAVVLFTVYFKLVSRTDTENLILLFISGFVGVFAFAFFNLCVIEKITNKRSIKDTVFYIFSESVGYGDFNLKKNPAGDAFQKIVENNDYKKSRTAITYFGGDVGDDPNFDVQFFNGITFPEIFDKIKTAWENLDYTGMGKYLSPAMLQTFKSCIDTMKKNRVIPFIDHLSFSQINIERTYKDGAKNYIEMWATMRLKYYVVNSKRKVIWGDDQNTYFTRWEFLLERTCGAVTGIESLKNCPRCNTRLGADFVPICPHCGLEFEIDGDDWVIAESCITEHDFN
jgi:hypothetical protein